MNTVHFRNIINGRIEYINPTIRHGEHIVDIAREVFNVEPNYIIRQGGEILDINILINDINVGENIYIINNLRNNELLDNNEHNNNLHNEEEYVEQMNTLYEMGVATNNNSSIILDILRINNGNVESVINTMFQLQI